MITEPSQLNVQCGFCHAQLQLVARPKDQRPDPGIDENARLASLRAQLQAEERDGPYRTVAPDGLRPFAAMLTQPDARPAAIEAIRREWESARGAAMSQRTRETGTRLFRIALLLERFYVVQGEDERARAVLETALGIVPEPGQRDILRCRLAREALDKGDEQAYHAWIADCAQRPLHLEVDSELRCTRARYCNHVRKFGYALDELGYGVPIASDRADLAHCLRAHAHVGLGQESEARVQITQLLGSAPDPVEKARVEFSDNPGPAGSLASAVAREMKSPKQLPGAVQPPVATHKKKKSGTGCLGGLGCLGPAIPAAIFLLPMVFPMLWFNACGMDAVHEGAIAALNQCPAAVAKVGANPQAAPGFNCGNCEFENGHGEMSYSYAVSGENGRGSMYVYATKSGGSWTIHTATLDAGGEEINLLACSGAGGAPTVFQGTTIPPGVVTPGVPPTGGNETIQLEGTQGLDFAATVLETRCSTGHAQSCSSLGTMYRHGAGVGQDLAKARELFQTACDLGSQNDCRTVQNL